MPATEIKQRGWRGVVRSLGPDGAVLITNHGHPEAVIMRPEEYARLAERAQRADERVEIELQTLRRRFDERLAVLGEAKAAARLRATLRGGAELGGKVKAGASY